MTPLDHFYPSSSSPNKLNEQEEIPIAFYVIFGVVFGLLMYLVYKLFCSGTTGEGELVPIISGQPPRPPNHRQSLPELKRANAVLELNIQDMEFHSV